MGALSLSGGSTAVIQWMVDSQLPSRNWSVIAWASAGLLALYLISMGLRRGCTRRSSEPQQHKMPQSPKTATAAFLLQYRSFASVPGCCFLSRQNSTVSIRSIHSLSSSDSTTPSNISSFSRRKRRRLTGVFAAGC